VVTRYFGGTKLGTGGLVRAYSDAVRQVVALAPRARKVPVHIVMVGLPYNLFEQTRLLVEAHEGQLLDQDFAAEITLTVRFPTIRLNSFQAALSELTNGTRQAILIETGEVLMPLSDPDK
jgi:putative IMPACT (imprinted ancient) family translation regulator